MNSQCLNGGETGVILAAQYGQVKTVDLLINAGTDIDIEHDYHYTALMRIVSRS